MDIFAHALWGIIAFHWLPNWWLVALFSILPDIAAFGMDFFRWMKRNTRKMSRDDILKSIPPYVYRIYDVTHSLVIVGTLFIFLFFISRHTSYYILPWILHILLDIPTHSKEFFPTPVFYPFSRWSFDGFNWARPWFIFVNYSLLIGVMVWLTLVLV